MSLNILRVKTREMKPVDFSKVDIASTYDIETCIAIATMKDMQGTLSHLTIQDSIEDLMKFLDSEAPRDSRVYLVGGWKRSQQPALANPQPESDIYLKQLRSALDKNGYRIKGESVLHPQGHGCNLIMRPNPPIEVQKYQLIRTPRGEQKFERGYITLD